MRIHPNVTLFGIRTTPPLRFRIDYNVGSWFRPSGARSQELLTPQRSRWMVSLEDFIIIYHVRRYFNHIFVIFLIVHLLAFPLSQMRRPGPRRRSDALRRRTLVIQRCTCLSLRDFHLHREVTPDGVVTFCEIFAWVSCYPRGSKGRNQVSIGPVLCLLHLNPQITLDN